MRLAAGIACAALLLSAANETRDMARKDGAAMLDTVRRQWPDAMIPMAARTGAWTYEVGTMLDGVAAFSEAAHDPAGFAYVKAAVDRWVDSEGTIHVLPGKEFPVEAHTLDDLEPGRAVMLCWRRTHDPRYRKAADQLMAALDKQPRTAEGGYWHKQVYPEQMWLDGAYMAEPFRAAYAAEFGQAQMFDDIAKQFELMARHTRDGKTGLLRHGWDAAHTQPWADAATGQSQEAWARADGWYMMSLVDSLPFFPAKHPARARLSAEFARLAQGLARYQDAKTGLWWDVLDKGERAGNFREASASAMFVYAFAKGVRLAYLPAAFRGNAERGWAGIEHEFITHGEDGTVTLHGTVKVSGLGGKPYRAGDYAYYVHEPVGDNDAKGVGAYLLAASELAR